MNRASSLRADLIPLTKAAPAPTLLRSSSLSFAGNSGFVLLGLITGVILARTLGPAGRGLMTTVIVWPTVLTSVSGLSLHDSTLYFAAAEPALRRRLFANATFAALVQAGLVALVAAVVLPRLIPLTDEQRHLLFINLALLPLWLWVELAGMLVQSRQRFDLVAMTRLVAPLVSCATLATLLGLHRLSVHTAMWALWIGLGAQATFTLTLCARHGDVSLRGDRALFRRCLRYSARVHVGTLAGIGNRRLDQLLLTALVTATPLGLYAFAKTMTELLGNVASSVSMALFPRVATERDADERRRLVAHSARWTLILQLAAALGMAAAAPTVIRLVWGGAFNAAVPIIVALLPATVLLGVRTTLAAALLGAGRPLGGAYAELGALALSAPLALFLIPRFGVVGAAASVSAAAAINCGIALWQFGRCFGWQTVRALRPRRADLSEARRLVGALDVARLDALVCAALFATLTLALLAFGRPWHGSLPRSLADARNAWVLATGQPKGWFATIGLVVTLVLVWLRVRRSDDAAPSHWRTLALVVLLQALWFGVGLVTAPDTLEALGELRSYALMLGVLVIVVASPAARRGALAAIVVGALAIAAVVLAEIRGLYLPGLGAAIDHLVVRPVAMMSHRNVAATALGLALPLLAMAPWAMRTRLGALLPLAGLATVMAALAATGSRASLLGALVGTFVALFKARRRILGDGDRLPLLATALVVAMALRCWSPAALPLAPLGPTAVPLTEKLERMFDERDVSRADHLTLWRFALGRMAAHPLVGERAAAFGRAWHANHPATVRTGADNVWLRVGATHGIPSLLLWLVAGLWLSRRALQLPVAGGDGDDTLVGAALSGAVIAGLVICVFEDVIAMPGVNLELAALTGTLLSWRSAHSWSAAQKEKSWPGS